MGERAVSNCSEEARLRPLLERTYAARAARLAPADDAFAKITAALDARITPHRRRADHLRLFGACALAALLLLLLSPVARSEFTATTRNAPRSVSTPMTDMVGGGSVTGAASDRAAAPPIVHVASEAAGAASAGQSNATGPTLAANGAAPTGGTSETPLHDLLARAGIRAADPPGGSGSR